MDKQVKAQAKRERKAARGPGFSRPVAGLQPEKWAAMKAVYRMVTEPFRAEPERIADDAQSLPASPRETVKAG